MSMQEIAAKIEKKQLLEELDILKKLDGEGQEVVSKEEILQVIQAKEKALLEEISYLEKKEAALVGGEYDLSLFDKSILCEDSEIILRKAIADDGEPYYQLKKGYLSEESLYYTIAKKEDNAFIGYCGVKNLDRRIWEIAIEIKSNCCHKGYGYRALKMYLETVAGISKRHEFASRVDTDNIASQNLMEKLGFQPYGLSEFLLHKEEDQLAAEEEYKDKLDDRYMVLAKKFNVEPRKLLSHVLEYRIIV